MVVGDGAGGRGKRGRRQGGWGGGGEEINGRPVGGLGFSLFLVRINCWRHTTVRADRGRGGRSGPSAALAATFLYFSSVNFVKTIDACPSRHANRSDICRSA